eukprot:7372156-Karenia_brevis.AAC.1
MAGETLRPAVDLSEPDLDFVECRLDFDVARDVALEVALDDFPLAWRLDTTEPGPRCECSDSASLFFSFLSTPVDIGVSPDRLGELHTQIADHVSI